MVDNRNIQMLIKEKIYQIGTLINNDINNNSLYASDKKDYSKLMNLLDNIYNDVFTELNYGLAWKKDLSHLSCHTGQSCNCFDINYIETDNDIIYKITSYFYYNTEHTVKFIKKSKKLIYVSNIKTDVRNNSINYIGKNVNVEMKYEDIVKKILNVFE